MRWPSAIAGGGRRRAKEVTPKARNKIRSRAGGRHSESFAFSRHALGVLISRIHDAALPLSQSIRVANSWQRALQTPISTLLPYEKPLPPLPPSSLPPPFLVAAIVSAEILTSDFSLRLSYFFTAILRFRALISRITRGEEEQQRETEAAITGGGNRGDDEASIDDSRRWPSMSARGDT